MKKKWDIYDFHLSWDTKHLWSILKSSHTKYAES